VTVSQIKYYAEGLQNGKGLQHTNFSPQSPFNSTQKFTVLVKKEMGFKIVTRSTANESWQSLYS
jgi:hypothetical protein